MTNTGLVTSVETAPVDIQEQGCRVVALCFVNVERVSLVRTVFEIRVSGFRNARAPFRLGSSDLSPSLVDCPYVSGCVYIL